MVAIRTRRRPNHDDAPHAALRADAAVTEDRFERVAAYLRENWHLITEDESAYKPAYVAAIADVVRRADAGEVGWDAVLEADRPAADHALGWRVVGPLLDVVRTWPDAFSTGVRAMLERQNADALWEAVTEAAGGPSRLESIAPLRGLGVRASVASYFFFVHDPLRWPMYRKDNFGTPLAKLTGEPLDESTPAHLLWSYYRGLDELGGRLRYAGLPVTSRLDVQGVLWVAKYKELV